MTERRDFYVYMLFRHDTGEPFYVGKGCGRRWVRHHHVLGSNAHKDRIIRKSLTAGHYPPCVKLADGLTETEAFSIEVAFIAAVGRNKVGGPLANATDGGEGTSGAVASAETKAKLSAAQKKIGNRPPRMVGNKFAAGKPAWNAGMKMSQEHRDKLSAAHKGKPSSRKGVKASEETRARIRASKQHVSDETRAKISAGLRGKKPLLTPAGIARKRAATIATWTGRSHSAETREKISRAKTGVSIASAGPRSEETKEKISAALKGKPWTEARRNAVKRMKS
jgi:NUMOD3 motif